LEKQIKELIKPILESQREVGVESGLEKTVILLELHGKGSRRVMKELGGKIKIEDGVEIKIVENAKVYVEYEPQTRIEGEIQQMDANFPVCQISDLIKNPLLGRLNEEEITVFDSVGFALEDYSILNYVYNRAKENDIGEFINIVPMLEDMRDLFGIL
jgi:ornithine cyclodeaminase